jgi:DNA polymerase
VPKADQQHWSAAPFVPADADLGALSLAAAGCTGCPLHRDTTQTVFGTGPAGASIVLVGEQPGDVEDRKGQPFVGPAGRVLWACVEEAGLARDELYVTNAVKHFKHEDRGKRRLHKRPTSAETVACRPWLDAELRAVAAPVIVAMGATAARSVFDRALPVEANRGRALNAAGRVAIVTYHPSAVLRATDEAARMRAAIVEDLRLAQSLRS